MSRLLSPKFKLAKDWNLQDVSAALEETVNNTPTTYVSEEKLIIALDFGTTYSGIAYCFPNQANSRVATVVNWPGPGGDAYSSEKVPTLIRYDGQNYAWGAEVDGLADNITGVKLLLDPNQPKSFYLPAGNVKHDLKNLPKRPYLVASDFVRAVYKHALSEIAKEVPSEYMGLCQKQFVLSVPAVWSDAAKAATLQAAKEAGLFPVTLIKEPEAAALHTLHDLSFALKPGQAFVVCDAGGGTVDLISYEVEKTTPRLTLNEIVPGTGSMSGSLGLNRRFEEAVKALIGEEELFRLKKTKAWLQASQQFDREIKRKFKGKGTEEYFVNFPMADLEDDHENRLESNCWAMTSDVVKDIFEPLVHDVVRLIEDQAKSVMLKHEYSLSGIMLVGGFGSSQHLKECVERRFPDIHVMQPRDAWSAIVRGAALSKVPNAGVKVQSTMATRHYGVLTFNEFEPGLDDGEVIQVHRDGSVRVERFTWFISIGEELDRDQSVKYTVFRDFDLDPPADQLMFFDPLWECSDVEQPRHVSKGDKLKVNCKVSSDLRSVPKDKYKRKTRAGGAAYDELHYQLCVKHESALMMFECEVDGKVMGSVKVDYKI